MTASCSFFFDSAVRVSAGTLMLAKGMVFLSVGVPGVRGSVGVVRGQEVLDADAVVELGADAVRDGGDDLAAVSRGIDVGAERTAAVGRPTTRTISSATSCTSAPAGTIPARRSVSSFRSAPYSSSCAATRAASEGAAAFVKWFVPEVKAPGTTIEVSIPKRMSSAA